MGSAKFSVVSVQIDWKTSDAISDDNSRKADFFNEYKPSPDLGSPSYTGLGAFATDSHFGCHTGVQFSGTVIPPDYKGKVVLRRTLIEGKEYDSVKGLIKILPNDDNPPNDTSQPGARDDDPQSGASKGVVYDLDAPGINEMVSPQNAYLRMNLTEYAVLDDDRNNVTVSDPFPWFTRVSCGMNENNLRIIFLLTDANDNLVGKGSTSLSQ